jgi:hypothetical protein
MQNPTIAPSGKKVYGGEERKKRITKIVDTSLRFNAQWQRTQSAWTKNLISQNPMGNGKFICISLIGMFQSVRMKGKWCISASL